MPWFDVKSVTEISILEKITRQRSAYINAGHVQGAAKLASALFLMNILKLGRDLLQRIHCKKRLALSRPQLWLVTSQLGTGKSLTFFTVYNISRKSLPFR